MRKLIIILGIIILIHIIFINIYDNVFSIKFDTETAIKQLEDSNYIESRFIAKGGPYKLLNSIFVFNEIIIVIYIAIKIIKKYMTKESAE